MTVRDVLSRHTSLELAEWMAYESEEPFGDKRADLHNANLCALLANIHRAPERSPYKLQDFMLRFWEYRDQGKNLSERLLMYFTALKQAQEAHSGRP